MRYLCVYNKQDNCLKFEQVTTVKMFRSFRLTNPTILVITRSIFLNEKNLAYLYIYVASTYLIDKFSAHILGII